MTLFTASTKLPRRSLLALIIVICAVSYQFSQHLIGTRISTPCLIQDLLQFWTRDANAFLNTHQGAANALIILNSLFGDLSILMLLGVTLWRASVRSFVPLFVFIFFRQALQLLITFPPMPGMIFHDPGFPSLFVNYASDTSFYFSAFVGTNILSALERSYWKIRWVNGVGVLIVLFVAITDILLRTHYTADLYTSMIVALFAFYFTQNLSARIDHYLQKFGKLTRPILILVLCGCLGAYLTAQHYINMKPLSSCGIVDAVQNFFYPINQWMTITPSIGNAFLIFMNAIQDAIFFYILIYTIWTRKLVLYITFALFLITRQTLQMLVHLPLPPHTIWHYPGFPSLFQNYNITDDLYFSGHTGTSLIFALHLAEYGRRWLTLTGFVTFAFMALFVIIMQIHYTMDVFSAILTVICISTLAHRWAPSVSRWLARI